MAKVAINQTDVSVRIKMLVNATGVPATGIVAASAGHVIYYQRGENTAIVTDSTSASDLASITATHSDWGFEEIGYGWYRVDFPDAAFAEGKGSVLCGMATTAESCVEVTVDIEPLFKYQGKASSVTSTTTTFPAGTTPLVGDQIAVMDGQGEPGNAVLVTSVTGEVATHQAFETGISATTTTILLIAGTEAEATAIANADVAISSLSTLSSSEVNSACDEAISDYFDVLKNTNGFFDTNIQEVNDVTVDGIGTTGDPWNPA